MGMEFNLKRPCANCPFRTDVTPYLNRARVMELKRELVIGDKTFTCHKTSHKLGASEDQKEEHCAGALILLEKLNSPNQMMRIAGRLGYYKYKELDLNSPVFNSFEEMANAQ